MSSGLPRGQSHISERVSPPPGRAIACGTISPRKAAGNSAPWQHLQRKVLHFVCEPRGPITPGVARYARCLPQCQKEMTRRMGPGVGRDDSLRGSEHLNQITPVETAKKGYAIALPWRGEISVVLSTSLRAKRSNPEAAKKELDCFVASAP